MTAPNTVVTAEGPHRTLTYRPELDGLRGVAILLVVALHAGVPFTGHAGRIGVMLFFVLSGYLITGLMVAERRATGTVRLRAFYARRARRLLPALPPVLLVAGLIGVWYHVLPQMAAPIAMVILYLAPVSTYVGVDMRWLAHTWTLGIEEQFYLLWPAIFLLRSRRAAVLALIAGVALYSISVLALAGGCLLALLPMQRVPRVALPIAVVSLVSVVWIPTAIAVPAVLMMIVLSCWVIVGWLSTRPPTAHSVLSWPPLVWVGLISYGLYLWHPVILVTRVPAVLGVPIAFLVAWASHRWIEGPFRRRRRAPAEGGGQVAVAAQSVS